MPGFSTKIDRLWRATNDRVILVNRRILIDPFSQPYFNYTFAYIFCLNLIFCKTNVCFHQSWNIHWPSSFERSNTWKKISVNFYRRREFASLLRRTWRRNIIVKNIVVNLQNQWSHPRSTYVRLMPLHRQDHVPILVVCSTNPLWYCHRYSAGIVL